jgi:ubiquinol-cytochrome c reductase cytochrome c1 subunit
MRINRSRVPRGRWLLAAILECVLITGAAAALTTVHAAEEAGAAAGKEAAGKEAGGKEEAWGADWRSWRANTNVSNIASLQRGARNFASYCLGCHSLKYERWSRMAKDLDIPEDILTKDVLPPGDKAASYILTSMPAADAETWFGKTPPDLSLMARARGKDYLFRLFMTYYVDPARPTGANNLQLPAIAMPAVLSELEGVKRAVFKDGELDHFEQVAPGRLTRAEYEGFVRDTVNFLDYVGEPAQAARRSLGVWVVLFLLVFTWLAWLMKKEFWKDVH